MALSDAAAERLLLLEGGRDSAAIFASRSLDPHLSASARFDLLAKAVCCDGADADLRERLARAALDAGDARSAANSARMATR